MFYCENCYLLNEENTCAFCGSRLTRGPKMDDYCFIGNKCSPWAEMYHGILKDDHIRHHPPVEPAHRGLYRRGRHPDGLLRPLLRA